MGSETSLDGAPAAFRNAGGRLRLPDGKGRPGGPLRVLDLFSGIGGFALGLERAGMKTVAFCEVNSASREKLAKHWPEVPCYDDVRSLTADRLAADGLGGVDVVCGGFPCQDISVNGRNRGLSGARSGLWFEMLRVITETRPQWVIAENVAALRSRGLDEVLGGLAAIGYDAEWHCIPASAIGADHERDRVWIVAHPARGGWGEHGDERGADRDQGAGQPALGGEGVAGWERPLIGPEAIREWAATDIWRGSQSRMGRKADGLSARMDGDRPVAAWEGNTPRVVAPGYPNRRPRLIALGNSIVPQIAELLGRAVVAAEAAISRSATLTGPGIDRSPVSQRLIVRTSTSSTLAAATCDSPSASSAALNSSADNAAVLQQAQAVAGQQGADRSVVLVHGEGVGQAAVAAEQRQALGPVGADGDEANGLGGHRGGGDREGGALAHDLSIPDHWPGWQEVFSA